MPNRIRTVRDFRARQQSTPRASVIAIRPAQDVERKAPQPAKTITMPLLLENAPHAYLAHGSLNALRNSFHLSRTKTLDMLLTGICLAVTGDTRRRA